MEINPVGLFPNQVQTGTSLDSHWKTMIPVLNATKASLADDKTNPFKINEKIDKKSLTSISIIFFFGFGLAELALKFAKITIYPDIQAKICSEEDK